MSSGGHGPAVKWTVVRDRDKCYAYQSTVLVKACLYCGKTYSDIKVQTCTGCGASRWGYK